MFRQSESLGSDSLAPEIIKMSQLDMLFWPQLYSVDESHIIFEELMKRVAWRQEHIMMYGRQMKVPRLSAWHADSKRDYSYSGIQHQPNPWIEPLQSIKDKVESLSHAQFNSVLCNLYRDGSDSVAWHSDDEPELGKNPTIVSLSFGQKRVFEFRRIDDYSTKFKLALPSGSCLIMQGETQHAWQHQIPKTTAQLQSRINLTFRFIA